MRVLNYFLVKLSGIAMFRQNVGGRNIKLTKHREFFFNGLKPSMNHPLLLKTTNNQDASITTVQYSNPPSKKVPLNCKWCNACTLLKIVH